MELLSQMELELKDLKILSLFVLQKIRKPITRIEMKEMLSFAIPWEHNEKMPFCKTGKEFSPGTKLAMTLILDLTMPQNCEKKMLV